MIKTQVDRIAVLLHHPLLYHAALMIDLIPPILLLLSVCQRPVFPADGYLGRLDKVQFYEISRLFPNPFCASM
jgi:hypothetical protein